MWGGGIGRRVVATMLAAYERCSLEVRACEVTSRKDTLARSQYPHRQILAPTNSYKHICDWWFWSGVQAR